MTTNTEVLALTNLLRDEWRLNHNWINAPWDCVSADCPYLGKPMQKHCGCFDEAQAAHAFKVKEATR